MCCKFLWKCIIVINIFEHWRVLIIISEFTNSLFLKSESQHRAVGVGGLMNCYQYRWATVNDSSLVCCSQLTYYSPFNLNNTYKTRYRWDNQDSIFMQIKNLNSLCLKFRTNALMGSSQLLVLIVPTKLLEWKMCKVL